MVTQPSLEATRNEPAPIRRRPWWSRVSAGQVFMVVAGILAFVTNFALLRGRDESVMVAVAARDINQGVAFSGDAVRMVEMDASDEILDTLVTADSVSRLEGRIVGVPLQAGELLNRSDLRAASAPLELRALSIGVDPQHAVGGAITVGDRVDVIAVDDKAARYVLVGAEVLAVPSTERRGLTGGGSFYVVVAVDAQQALEVSLAMRTGSIEVVRSTGAAIPEELELVPLPDESERPVGD